MATFTKHFLSGSTSGIGIVVHASDSGTASTIHVAPVGTASKDEVWLWAYNGHTADLVLSTEWGTSANPRKVTIESQAGLVPTKPGLLIQNGLKITAFAGSAGMIIVDGFVNRITD